MVTAIDVEILSAKPSNLWKGCARDRDQRSWMFKIMLIKVMLIVMTMLLEQWMIADEDVVRHESMTTSNLPSSS